MKRITFTFMVFFVALFLSGCNKDQAEIDPLASPVDLVITLGLQVNYKSCTPRELLKYRVARAVEVGSQLKNPVYFATGKGNPISVRECVARGKLTEAQAIRQILMEQYKIPQNRILLEEESTTTDQNAQYAKVLIDQLKQSGVKIASYQLVSSHYHIYRGNSDGRDNSAMHSFNQVFGDGFFTPKNSFSSSAFSADEIWGDEFVRNNDWLPGNDMITLADVNGDGKSDIVAFRGSDVYVALSTGKRFAKSQLWSQSLISVANEPLARLAADVNGDGLADLISVTDSQIFIGLSTGEKFETQQNWSDFEFPRQAMDRVQVLDVDGDKRADITFFAKDGTYVAYSTGQGFRVVKVSSRFGHMSVIEATDKRTFAKDRGGKNISNRIFADVNGDGLADIVVYGYKGIYTALQTPPHQFGELLCALAKSGPKCEGITGEGDKADFTGWNNDLYLKTALDMTGNGRADLVNLGNRDLFIALSTGQRFEYLGGVTAVYTINNRLPIITDHWKNFVTKKGWKNTTHFRLLGDVDGNGLNDLVGFADDKIVVTRNLHP